MIRTKKGLNIPLAGSPEQRIETGNAVTRVAVVGRDFIGLKPSMEITVGDHVVLGQPLFTDRKNPGVRFVAPGTGTISTVNRGERRILQSVVIDLDDPAEDASPETFNRWTAEAIGELNATQVRENLIASGLWVALRTRPFSRVPAVDGEADAIFITATDTNPLAPDPQIVIGHDAEAFRAGVAVLCRLADKPVHLCIGAGADIPAPQAANLVITEFAGPHPAGLAGTHIHFLYPVDANRTVWTIGYQDVIAIGELFTTGRLRTERIVSLGGPLVRNPRLVTARWGASTEDLVKDELTQSRARIIAGSALSGRRAAGWGAYLGRRHNQITALAEGDQREMFGWITPGLKKFSAWRVFLSSLFGGREFALNTSLNGSVRAMVPTGAYEKVMPMDILATQLLRALLVKDTVQAQELGCLELHEEDLALCSFVCPSKYDYGPVLRANLEQIEKEG